MIKPPTVLVGGFFIVKINKGQHLFDCKTVIPSSLNIKKLTALPNLKPSTLTV